MSSTLNVQLTNALRKYVDERASDKDVYATPSEHIRDLLRQDMQDRAAALNIIEVRKFGRMIGESRAVASAAVSASIPPQGLEANRKGQIIPRRFRVDELFDDTMAELGI